MFSFLNYIYEIWTVGTVNGVDIGVAYDMFRTDVREGRTLDNTGKALADFDFAAARDAWETLAEKEQEAAYEEWHAFLGDCYAEACAAFADGEDAMAALVEEWRADREAD